MKKKNEILACLGKGKVLGGVWGVQRQFSSCRQEGEKVGSGGTGNLPLFGVVHAISLIRLILLF
jgi:hypothetical protein